jgi:hypothetical protein
MVEINSDLKYSLKPLIMPSLVMIVKHFTIGLPPVLKAEPSGNNSIYYLRGVFFLPTRSS